MAVSLREVVSFGRYEPLFRIASGGMAEVFAARIRGEAGFQKLVAVKRMHAHMASDQSFVDMFLNEARLAAHISSPNVVQTLDLGRGSDGSLYIVMELVVGLSLAALVEQRRAPLPVPVVLSLMAQAAQGLDDAHEATTPAGDELGLVHRDISPHNILVGLDGRARVTDFGIARAVNAPRSETNVKELKGKFAYMSPEQTRLKPLDHRSDVFSLGVVTWELLVGDKLFSDLDPSLTIRNVRRRDIAPPHERVPAVPTEVSEVVLRALQRLPAKRFQTAGAFAEALRQAGQAAGGLPSRKRVGQFVRETGGEELERLQRLIRLGTEGAVEEDFERVRPGSTQVLGTADASGIARIADGTDSGVARPPTLVTVTLPEDDEAVEELDDLDMIELDEPRPAPGATINARPKARPAAIEAPLADAATTEHVRVRVDPTAPPLVAPAPEPPRRSATWVLLGGLGGLALVGAAAAAIWMAPGPTASETLPDAPVGERAAEAPPPEPAPPEATASSTEPGASPTTPSPTASETAPDVPSAEPGAEAVAEDGGGDGSVDEEDTTTEPTPGRRGRRRRRGGRRAQGSETDGEAPLLLDVDAFDQRVR